jgi:hypothetical protein
MKLTQRNQTALGRSADALLRDVLVDELGAVSLSVYDTARVVTLTPGLPGQRGRIDFILAQQATDGSWGAADGYALVPTLSAVEALLGLLSTPPVVARHAVARATRLGLVALHRWLRPGSGFCTPDTIAVEFLVPALVEAVNARLAALPAEVDVPAELRVSLALPSDLDGELLDRVRGAIAAGAALPPKLWASLEAFGPAATAGVRAVGGAVGASPSATAALLASQPDPAAEPQRLLEDLTARGDGAVPGVIPITFFEQAWTLNAFALAGIGHSAPPAMLDSLEAALTPEGVPAAPGLPADSDDTAAALYALALHGRPQRPDSLLRFRTDGYFTCFPSERTPSISTNAHILEALGSYVSHRPAERARFGPSIDMVSEWLLANQWSDGSWLDKWHASAYYATSCCVLALIAYGPPNSAAAIERAVTWVLETQHGDGSWGRWGGSIEETAYSVQMLLRSGAAVRDEYAAGAVRAGCAYLETADDPAAYPGLWHAKDLYAPVRVIAAARLAALHMAASQLSLTTAAAG